MIRFPKIFRPHFLKTFSLQQTHTREPRQKTTAITSALFQILNPKTSNDSKKNSFSIFSIFSVEKTSIWNRAESYSNVKISMLGLMFASTPKASVASVARLWQCSSQAEAARAESC
jgi:hypothetical protein